jgi:hypothetical protein
MTLIELLTDFTLQNVALGAAILHADLVVMGGIAATALAVVAALGLVAIGIVPVNRRGRRE